MLRMYLDSGYIWNHSLSSSSNSMFPNLPVPNILRWVKAMLRRKLYWTATRASNFTVFWNNRRLIGSYLYSLVLARDLFLKIIIHLLICFLCSIDSMWFDWLNVIVKSTSREILLVWSREIIVLVFLPWPRACRLHSTCYLLVESRNVFASFWSVFSSVCRWVCCSLSLFLWLMRRIRWNEKSCSPSLQLAAGPPPCSPPSPSPSPATPTWPVTSTPNCRCQ